MDIKDFEESLNMTEKIQPIGDLTKLGWFVKCQELQDEVNRLRSLLEGHEIRMWEQWLDFERKALEKKENQLKRWKADNQ